MPSSDPQEIPIQPKQANAELEVGRLSPPRPWYLPLAHLNSTEGLAFAYFRQHTASQLQTRFHTRIWEQIALQLAHHETVVLDAIIAVGSLHRAARATTTTDTPPDDRLALQGFALDRYSRAMLRLRSYMTAIPSHRPVDVVLLSCLLFVCFEMLQDGQSAAMTHLRNGLRIIYDEYKSQLEFATTYHSAVVLKGVRREVVNDVISIFSQLDYDTSLLGTQRSSLTLEKGEGSSPKITSLPTYFQSSDEARSYLDLLAIDIVRVQGDLFQVATDSAELDPNAPSDLGSRQAYIHALTRIVDLGDDNNRIAERHNVLKQQLAHFDLAMTELRSNPNPTHEPEAILLQLQYTLLFFLTASLRNSHEIECDQFIPIFAETIELAERYIELGAAHHESTQNQSFSLQENVLRLIYLVGIKCREPTWRRRAVQLLHEGDFQESMWDSEAYAKLMQRLIDVEEASAVCQPCTQAADVPEEARVCDVLVTGDLSNPKAARMVLAKYVRVNREAYPTIVVAEAHPSQSEGTSDGCVEV